MQLTLFREILSRNLIAIGISRRKLLGYLYLALSTIVVTGWALGYKIVVKRCDEIRSVNLWVYIGATTVMLIYFIASGHKYNSTAAWLGFATGFSTFVATITFFYHIRTGVLAVSWTVIGLAVVFPVAASIIFWHEQPSLKQWIGLCLIPIALILCNPGNGKAALPE